jgi:hypothetical protein
MGGEGPTGALCTGFTLAGGGGWLEWRSHPLVLMNININFVFSAWSCENI